MNISSSIEQLMKCITIYGGEATSIKYRISYLVSSWELMEVNLVSAVYVMLPIASMCISDPRIHDTWHNKRASI